jgi:hypothetical protein
MEFVWPLFISEPEVNPQAAGEQNVIWGHEAFPPFGD